MILQDKVAIVTGSRADVTLREDVEGMVQATEAQHGPVDIRVNNASIHFSITPFPQYAWDAFEKKVLGEMKALFHPCQVVGARMAERSNTEALAFMPKETRERVAANPRCAVRPARRHRQCRALLLFGLFATAADG